MDHMQFVIEVTNS